jgi:hypothetical protein
MSTYDRLRARWLESGIRPKPGVSREALNAFENEHRIRLPSAFKEYLVTANGMEEGQTDENMISFLSLQAINQKANYKEISTLEVDMVVAEYCIYSHMYVLRCSRNGDRSCILATDGEHEVQLATCFEDFVNNYLSSPASVTHCWEKKGEMDAL